MKSQGPPNVEPLAGETHKCSAKLEGSSRCRGSTEEGEVIKSLGFGKGVGRVTRRNRCLRWARINDWEFTVGRGPSREKRERAPEAWRQGEHGGSVHLDLRDVDAVGSH